MKIKLNWWNAKTFEYLVDNVKKIWMNCFSWQIKYNIATNLNNKCKINLKLSDWKQEQGQQFINKSLIKRSGPHRNQLSKWLYYRTRYKMSWLILMDESKTVQFSQTKELFLNWILCVLSCEWSPYWPS